LIPLHGDERARERLAVFIDDASGNHPAAREPEVDVRRGLSISQRHRCARLQRPALTVRRVDEAALRSRDGVVAGSKIADEITSLIVGDGGSAAASTAGGRANDRDPRPFDRPAGIRCEHASTDRRRAFRDVGAIACLPACLSASTRLRRGRGCLRQRRLPCDHGGQPQREQTGECGGAAGRHDEQTTTESARS
jgi:hypothetical protein